MRTMTGRGRAILLAAAFPVLITACGDGGAGGSTAIAPMPIASSSPTPTPTPTPPPTATAKLAIRGLVAMGKSSSNPASPPANAFEEINAHPGIYTAEVIDLFWSQLEPANGVFDDSAITAALGRLAAYNAANPATPVVAKLRIFAGAGTPTWVETGAGSVSVTDDSGVTQTVGRFWTSTYQGYWRGLQAHLAAAYDTNPMIGEVAISSCSTLTAEPFILPHGPAAVMALHTAGYSDAAGMACLSAAPADYAAWRTTPLDYTFNPFFATDSGAAGANTDFTVQVMTAFRGSLGVRGVVANHGLDTTLSAGAMPIYAAFQQLYAQARGQQPPALSPLEFQTLSPTVDWPSTIALGLTYHPTEIEIWDTVAAGGSAPLSQTQLAQWAAALRST